MKVNKQVQARKLRQQGLSMGAIAVRLGVSKSSVSLWVRHIKMSVHQEAHLRSLPFTTAAVEKRRKTRLLNEDLKRTRIINHAYEEIDAIGHRELWLIGVMLYWAEGGKTQRLVRFSNGDPRMIKMMMLFFREVCSVPEEKFRGYIHIHSHLDYRGAENYWSGISNIPLGQFFKTYRKKSSNSSAKNTLPHGVMDIYVLDTKLFLKISGWASGIFDRAQQAATINSRARVLELVDRPR
ncbi:MAG: hypothetical protein AAB971_02230 [Patescibacteria group bacterium]